MSGWRGPYETARDRALCARTATKRTGEINVLAETNSDLDVWNALRDLLGAHPNQSIEEAAERIARDAVPGAALRAARSIIATRGSDSPWADIRTALRVAGRLA